MKKTKESSEKGRNRHDVLRFLFHDGQTTHVCVDPGGRGSATLLLLAVKVLLVLLGSTHDDSFQTQPESRLLDLSRCLFEYTSPMSFVDSVDTTIGRKTCEQLKRACL
jgi:hypothetical protein